MATSYCATRSWRRVSASPTAPAAMQQSAAVSGAASDGAGARAARGHEPHSCPKRRLFGRGVAFPGDRFPVDACVCARPKRMVFCRGCGYFRIGRKRLPCPQHPAVLFLYDIEACEKCGVSCYLDEYDLGHQ